MNAPLVFIHFGKSYFLELSIRQALHSNPQTEIYLLGDEFNSSLSNICNHLSYNNYNNKDTALKEVYKHFSSNSYEFEFFCIKRWFVFLEFMKANNFPSIYVSDSDFLIYSDITTFAVNELSNMKAGYCIFNQAYEDFYWSASGHFAYITQAFLEDFCAFILDTYKTGFINLERKIRHHKENKIIYGGISDMTFLYLYYIKNKNSVLNFLTPIHDKVVDLDIGSGINYYIDEFKTKNGFKEIHFKNHVPYGITKEHKEIQIIGLHFQANAKFSMCNYYTGKVCNAFITLKYNHLRSKFESYIKNLIN